MPIHYYYFKNPVSKDNPEQEGKIHPRIVRSKKVTLDEICERISADSTFSAGEASGLLKEFSRAMLRELKDGNYVHWDGFGIFSVSLEAVSMSDPKEMLPSRVRIKRLNFRPFKSLKVTLENVKMVWIDRHPEFRYLTKEERKENILRYLHYHEMIQSADCISFNGCSRTTAARDLKELLQEGLIEWIPISGSRLYKLAKKGE